MDTVTRPEETVGRHYTRDGMLRARDRTFEAIARIAAQVRPGMKESEAVSVARATLKELGLLRGWHGIYVRFGENTLCTYTEKNAPDRILGEHDIFYVDIGPVFEKWEGDGGDTFVVGDDPEMHAAKRDVRRIFDLVQDQWRKEGLTGGALYDVAADTARSFGWQLYLEMAGHRLADFPHRALHDGTLRDFEHAPATDLWVLEIQIRHPRRPFGAFYEDLLLGET